MDCISLLTPGSLNLPHMRCCNHAEYHAHLLFQYTLLQSRNNRQMQTLFTQITPWYLSCKLKIMSTTLDLAVLGRGSKMGQSNAIHLDVAETSAPINQSRLLRRRARMFCKSLLFLRHQ